jgi:DNA-binding MarR family transcriptional regulator
MKLENEISQKTFESEYHKLSVNIFRTFHWLNERFAQLFKASGITNQQYNILRILRGQYPDPCSIKRLRERMLDKQSDASRLVQRLVEKGLAERKHSTSDRRKMDVMITQKGLSLLDQLDMQTRSVYNSFTTLNNLEAEDLNRLLDKLRD